MTYYNNNIGNNVNRDIRSENIHSNHYDYSDQPSNVFNGGGSFGTYDYNNSFGDSTQHGGGISNGYTFSDVMSKVRVGAILTIVSIIAGTVFMLYEPNIASMIMKVMFIPIIIFGFIVNKYPKKLFVANQVLNGVLTGFITGFVLIAEINGGYIVAQAILATVAVTFALLTLTTNNKTTFIEKPGFKYFIAIGSISYLIFMVISYFISLFTSFNVFWGFNPVAIGTSVLGIILFTFIMVSEFRKLYILSKENGSRTMTVEQAENEVALHAISVLETVTALYREILRLIAIFNRN